MKYTKHGLQRIKERVESDYSGQRKKVANDALKFGHPISYYNSNKIIYNYLKNKIGDIVKRKKVVIHGTSIFIFSKSSEKRYLITMYPISNKTVLSELELFKNKGSKVKRGITFNKIVTPKIKRKFKEDSEMIYKFGGIKIFKTEIDNTLNYYVSDNKMENYMTVPQEEFINVKENIDQFIIDKYNKLEEGE